MYLAASTTVCKLLDCDDGLWNPCTKNTSSQAVFAVLEPQGRMEPRTPKLGQLACYMNEALNIERNQVETWVNSQGTVAVFISRSLSE